MYLDSEVLARRMFVIVQNTRRVYRIISFEMLYS